MADFNVLSLSYGKDSIACIPACIELGIPIHAIVHAEVWATDDIPADLPPMCEFKKKADAIIKERWGLDVIHVCAMTTPDKKYGSFRQASLVDGAKSPTNPSSTNMWSPTLGESPIVDSPSSVRVGVSTSNQRVKKTYQDVFYRIPKRKRERERETECQMDSLKSTEIGAIRNSRSAFYGFAGHNFPWCQTELKRTPQELYKKTPF